MAKLCKAAAAGIQYRRSSQQVRKVLTTAEMAKRYTKGELIRKSHDDAAASIVLPLFLAAVRGHQADIMATKPPPRPVPRLYLATPVVDDPSPLTTGLPGLLAGVDVRRCWCGSSRPTRRTMISPRQGTGAGRAGQRAALLLDGHVELVARAGADGAHLTGAWQPWKDGAADLETRPHHWRRRPLDPARFDGRG